MAIQIVNAHDSGLAEAVSFLRVPHRITEHRKHLILKNLSLADTRRVIDAVRRTNDEFQTSVSLIVVDTLARAFGGGNENASDDMGAVIGNADKIRTDTGAHVQFVHHSGKDESKGSRGHSSLRAATDTEIEISVCDDAMHTAEIVKQREELGARVSDVVRLLYAVGLKVVPVDSVLVKRDTYEAVVTIAMKAMANPELARRLLVEE